MMRAICFDTETTGLLEEDQIVQLSVADAGSGEELLNLYFRPNDYLMERRWDGASKVTGIYPEDVAECPSLDDPEIFAEIQELFDSADIVIGYHVAYDIKMMEKAGFDMSRYVYQDPMLSYPLYYWTHHPEETTYTHSNGKTDPVWMESAPDGFGRYGRYCPRKLVAAAEELCGMTDFGAHDSMNDVYATIAVWRAMNDIQNACDMRGFAVDDDGNYVLDILGEPVLIDDQGYPMMTPDGRAFVYVQDYTRDELMEIDRIDYCSVE